MKDFIDEFIGAILFGIAMVALLFLVIFYQKVSLEHTCHIKVSWSDALLFNTDAGKCLVTK